MDKKYKIYKIVDEIRRSFLSDDLSIVIVRTSMHDKNEGFKFSNKHGYTFLTDEMIYEYGPKNSKEFILQELDKMKHFKEKRDI